MSVRARLRDVLIYRILGVADTPHRIAWGVSLGFLIAVTPTFGVQIMLYVALSTLLRANKISGVPLLFITNPLTLVPVYYAEWRLGCKMLGRLSAGEDPAAADILRRPAQSESWAELGRALLDVSGELWLGSIAVGLVGGAIGYGIAYWGVLAFRRARGVGAGSTDAGR